MRSRPELRAMLTVSRAVARGGPLPEVLDRIAAEAAGVVQGADRSSIILIEWRQHHFRLAGSYGLSESYRRLLSTGEAKLLPGEGPSGVAYESGAPVVIDDLDRDPRVATWAWREIAREERYRAIVSLPLIAADTVVGTLNVYRTRAGPWPEEQIRVLAFFAEHASGAVKTAQLLDQRSEQLAALRRLVRTLREQTHEHANRLHAVSGLLALGESDTQMVTILGNLLDNAFDAVVNMPPEQREVRVHLSDRRSGLVIKVSDLGKGLPRGEPPIFNSGVSTKPGHQGIGLPLVANAVAAARGTIEVSGEAGLTTFQVSIPG